MGNFELIIHQAGINYEDYKKLCAELDKDDYDKDRLIENLLGEKKAARIKKARENQEAILAQMESEQINYIDCTHEAFPDFLTRMPNPCYLLYYKGDIGLLDSFSIGIIGSRKPTQYGKYVANFFASGLAKKGVTIVSGFALGIDSESHKGATENKGKTIGVLGTSLDNIYPRSNKEYAKEILRQGNLLISEFMPGTQTLPHHFVQRNRLISAISSGLIIVEAGAKSGTLTTADHALDQGRQIFAVPGNINSKNSLGTNQLIKFGAKPIMELEDVLEEYPYFTSSPIMNEEIELSGDEKAVINMIQEKGMLTNEEIAFFTNINIKYIIGILSVLELKGIVKDLGNNSYMLN